MSSHVVGAERDADLRLRALTRLTGPGGPDDKRLTACAALGVLHELASSPATAVAALTLLHELQVHQVELDLQDEELRRSRAELEASLFRQIQLYDCAPAGYCTVDRSTTLRELNLTAADMLGSERDQLLGKTLNSFLTLQSVNALHAMLTRLCDGALTELGALQLMTGRRVHASAKRDPDGRLFLVAFVEVTEHGESLLRRPWADEP